METIDLNETIRTAAKLSRPIYIRNGWEWGTTWGDNPTAHIPTEEEIRETIFHLYNSALDYEENNGLDEEGISTATGRLQVEVAEDGEITVTVELAKLRDGCYD